MPSVDDEGLLNVFLGYPHLGGALSSCSISISLLLQVVSNLGWKFIALLADCVLLPSCKQFALPH